MHRLFFVVVCGCNWGQKYHSRLSCTYAMLLINQRNRYITYWGEIANDNDWKRRGKVYYINCLFWQTGLKVGGKGGGLTYLQVVKTTVWPPGGGLRRWRVSKGPAVADLHSPAVADLHGSGRRLVRRVSAHHLTSELLHKLRVRLTHLLRHLLTPGRVEKLDKTHKNGSKYVLSKGM